MQAIYASHPTIAIQDGMGVVQATVTKWSLEWLSTLIPIILSLVVVYCCVRRKRHQSTQTNAAEMDQLRPDPVGQDAQVQVGTELPALPAEPIYEEVPKDFILVVDEPSHDSEFDSDF